MSIICIFIAYFLRIVHRKKLYIFTTVVFAIMAFFVIPTEGMDLYRHYEMLDTMRQQGLENSIEIYQYSLRSLPMYALYFYIVSLLGSNQFLLAIAYVVVYGVQFTILHMAVEDFSLSRYGEKIGYICIICFTNAYELTGIRNMMAFAICVYFLYLELVRKKHKVISWIMYVMMCFFHDSVVIFLVFRIFLLFAKKKNLRWIILLIAVWPLCITKIIPILTSYVGNPFINGLVQKILLYTSEEATEAFSSGLSFMIVITIRILAIAIIWIGITINKNNVENKDWYLIFTSLVVFCIFGISAKTIVVRFVPLALYMAVPYMAKMFTLKQEFQKNYQNRKEINIFLQIMFLGVAFAHLLCLIVFQYPYFEIGIF